uniref:Uncharacterized protein n=1 Tax=Rhizophora mucronata TaxID=61149 RepID=A0A2P2QV33_RHIMU
MASIIAEKGNRQSNWN